MTTAIRSDTTPRTSILDRPTAMRLAATEYERFAAQLAALDHDDWSRPTSCPAWDVREVACHVLGMAAMIASMREGSRQRKAARARGGVFIDALTALQVEERANLTPAQVREGFVVMAPRAATARRRLPALLRRMRTPPETVNGRSEVWTLGYLTETILTRDTWMHRVDIARATGRDLLLTADHDGVLVADVAAEWAGRHGRPCTLALSGPAGGTWSWGVAGPAIELDAVEFCRVLSGRGSSTDLFDTAVPF